MGDMVYSCNKVLYDNICFLLVVIELTCDAPINHFFQSIQYEMPLLNLVQPLNQRLSPIKKFVHSDWSVKPIIDLRKYTMTSEAHARAIHIFALICCMCNTLIWF